MSDSEQSEDEFCDTLAMYLYTKYRRKRKLWSLLSLSYRKGFFSISKMSFPSFPPSSFGLCMRKSKLTHTENIHDRIISRKPTDVVSGKIRLIMIMIRFLIG